LEHARHVLRVTFVLVVVVSGILIGRSLLMPKSYGQYGAYRYDNVAEQMNIHEPRHGGAESCKACHEAKYAQREEGEVHMVVQCEVCHAPLAAHVRDGKKFADMHVERSWTLCARCHRKLEGRPQTIKQITFDEKHLKNNKLEGNVCRRCHEPHSTFFEES